MASFYVVEGGRPHQKIYYITTEAAAAAAKEVGGNVTTVTTTEDVLARAGYRADSARVATAAAERAAPPQPTTARPEPAAAGAPAATTPASSSPTRPPAASRADAVSMFRHAWFNRRDSFPRSFPAADLEGVLNLLEGRDTLQQGSLSRNNRNDVIRNIVGRVAAICGEAGYRPTALAGEVVQDLYRVTYLELDRRNGTVFDDSFPFARDWSAERRQAVRTAAAEIRQRSSGQPAVVVPQPASPVTSPPPVQQPEPVPAGAAPPATPPPSPATVTPGSPEAPAVQPSSTRLPADFTDKQKSVYAALEEYVGSLRDTAHLQSPSQEVVQLRRAAESRWIEALRLHGEGMPSGQLSRVFTHFYGENSGPNGTLSPEFRLASAAQNVGRDIFIGTGGDDSALLVVRPQNPENSTPSAPREPVATPQAPGSVAAPPAGVSSQVDIRSYTSKDATGALGMKALLALGGRDNSRLGLLTPAQKDLLIVKLGGHRSAYRSTQGISLPLTPSEVAEVEALFPTLKGLVDRIRPALTHLINGDNGRLDENAVRHFLADLEERYSMREARGVAAVRARAARAAISTIGLDDLHQRLRGIPSSPSPVISAAPAASSSPGLSIEEQRARYAFLAEVADYARFLDTGRSLLISRLNDHDRSLLVEALRQHGPNATDHLDFVDGRLRYLPEYQSLREDSRSQAIGGSIERIRAALVELNERFGQLTTNAAEGYLVTGTNEREVVGGRFRTRAAGFLRGLRGLRGSRSSYQSIPTGPIADFVTGVITAAGQIAPPPAAASAPGASPAPAPPAAPATAPPAPAPSTAPAPTDATAPPVPPEAPSAPQQPAGPVPEQPASAPAGAPPPPPAPVSPAPVPPAPAPTPEPVAAPVEPTSPTTERPPVAPTGPTTAPPLEGPAPSGTSPRPNPAAAAFGDSRRTPPQRPPAPVRPPVAPASGAIIDPLPRLETPLEKGVRLLTKAVDVRGRRGAIGAGVSPQEAPWYDFVTSRVEAIGKDGFAAELKEIENTVRQRINDATYAGSVITEDGDILLSVRQNHLNRLIEKTRTRIDSVSRPGSPATPRPSVREPAAQTLPAERPPAPASPPAAPGAPSEPVSAAPPGNPPPGLEPIAAPPSTQTLRPPVGGAPELVAPPAPPVSPQAPPTPSPSASPVPSAPVVVPVPPPPGSAVPAPAPVLTPVQQYLADKLLECVDRAAAAGSQNIGNTLQRDIEVIAPRPSTEDLVVAQRVVQGIVDARETSAGPLHNVLSRAVASAGQAIITGRATPIGVSSEAQAQRNGGVQIPPVEVPEATVALEIEKLETRIRELEEGLRTVRRDLIGAPSEEGRMRYRGAIITIQEDLRTTREDLGRLEAGGSRAQDRLLLHPERPAQQTSPASAVPLENPLLVPEPFAPTLAPSTLSPDQAYFAELLQDFVGLDPATAREQAAAALAPPGVEAPALALVETTPVTAEARPGGAVSPLEPAPAPPVVEAPVPAPSAAPPAQVGPAAPARPQEPVAAPLPAAVAAGGGPPAPVVEPEPTSAAPRPPVQEPPIVQPTPASPVPLVVEAPAPATPAPVSPQAPPSATPVSEAPPAPIPPAVAPSGDLRTLSPAELGDVFGIDLQSSGTQSTQTPRQLLASIGMTADALAVEVSRNELPTYRGLTEGQRAEVEGVVRERILTERSPAKPSHIPQAEWNRILDASDELLHSRTLRPLMDDLARSLGRTLRPLPTQSSSSPPPTRRRRTGRVQPPVAGPAAPRPTEFVPPSAPTPTPALVVVEVPPAVRPSVSAQASGEAAAPQQAPSAATAAQPPTTAAENQTQPASEAPMPTPAPPPLPARMDAAATQARSEALLRVRTAMQATALLGADAATPTFATLSAEERLWVVEALVGDPARPIPTEIATRVSIAAGEVRGASNGLFPTGVELDRPSMRALAGYMADESQHGPVEAARRIPPGEQAGLLRLDRRIQDNVLGLLAEPAAPTRPQQAPAPTPAAPPAPAPAPALVEPTPPVTAEARPGAAVPAEPAPALRPPAQEPPIVQPAPTATPSTAPTTPQSSTPQVQQAPAPAPTPPPTAPTVPSQTPAPVAGPSTSAPPAPTPRPAAAPSDPALVPVSVPTLEPIQTADEATRLLRIRISETATRPGTTLLSLMEAVERTRRELIRRGCTEHRCTVAIRQANPALFNAQVDMLANLSIGQREEAYRNFIQAIEDQANQVGGSQRSQLINESKSLVKKLKSEVAKRAAASSPGLRPSTPRPRSEASPSVGVESSEVQQVRVGSNGNGENGGGTQARVGRGEQGVRPGAPTSNREEVVVTRGQLAVRLDPPQPQSRQDPRLGRNDAANDNFVELGRGERVTPTGRVLRPVPLPGESSTTTSASRPEGSRRGEDGRGDEQEGRQTAADRGRQRGITPMDGGRRSGDPSTPGTRPDLQVIQGGEGSGATQSADASQRGIAPSSRGTTPQPQPSITPAAPPQVGSVIDTGASAAASPNSASTPAPTQPPQQATLVSGAQPTHPVGAPTSPAPTQPVVATPTAAPAVQPTAVVAGSPAPAAALQGSSAPAQAAALPTPTTPSAVPTSGSTTPSAAPAVQATAIVSASPATAPTGVPTPSAAIASAAPGGVSGGSPTAQAGAASAVGLVGAAALDAGRSADQPVKAVENNHPSEGTSNGKAKVASPTPEPLAPVGEAEPTRANGRLSRVQAYTAANLAMLGVPIVHGALTAGYEAYSKAIAKGLSEGEAMAEAAKAGGKAAGPGLAIFVITTATAKGVAYKLGVRGIAKEAAEELGGKVAGGVGIVLSIAMTAYELHEINESYKRGEITLRGAEAKKAQSLVQGGVGIGGGAIILATGATGGTALIAGAGVMGLSYLSGKAAENLDPNNPNYKSPAEKAKELTADYRDEVEARQEGDRTNEPGRVGESTVVIPKAISEEEAAKRREENRRTNIGIWREAAQLEEVDTFAPPIDLIDGPTDKVVEELERQKRKKVNVELWKKAREARFVEGEAPPKELMYASKEEIEKVIEKRRRELMNMGLWDIANKKGYVRSEEIPAKLVNAERNEFNKGIWEEAYEQGLVEKREIPKELLWVEPEELFGAIEQNKEAMIPLTEKTKEFFDRNLVKPLVRAGYTTVDSFVKTGKTLDRTLVTPLVDAGYTTVDSFKKLGRPVVRALVKPKPEVLESASHDEVRVPARKAVSRVTIPSVDGGARRREFNKNFNLELWKKAYDSGEVSTEMPPAELLYESADKVMPELEKQKLAKAEASSQRPVMMVKPEDEDAMRRRYRELPQIAGGVTASRAEQSLYGARAFVSGLFGRK